MRFRRVTCFVLGLWLGGRLLMAVAGVVRTSATWTACWPDPVPRRPRGIRTLGYSRTRALLRYQVAEQNRVYFETWEAAQIGLGARFFLDMLFGSHGEQVRIGRSC